MVRTLRQAPERVPAHAAWAGLRWFLWALWRPSSAVATTPSPTLDMRAADPIFVVGFLSARSLRGAMSYLHAGRMGGGRRWCCASNKGI